MTRFFLLFLGVLISATHEVEFSNKADIPGYYSFPMHNVFRGQYTLTKVGDIKSCPVKPWTSAQTNARVRKLRFNLKRPFNMIPMVTYSITAIDVDKNYNTRYKLSLLEVDYAYCLFQFEVWCNSFVYSAEMTFFLSGYWVHGATENVIGRSGAMTTVDSADLTEVEG